jgi:hypothetical protein
MIYSGLKHDGDPVPLKKAPALLLRRFRVWWAWNVWEKRPVSYSQHARIVEALHKRIKRMESAR